MKIVTLRRDPRDRDLFEVHLELAGACRAVLEWVVWHGSWVLMGIALHRAYVHVLMHF